MSAENGWDRFDMSSQWINLHIIWSIQWQYIRLCLFGKRKLSNTSQHELPALQILRQWMPESSESDGEKEKGILLDDYSELIPRSNTFVLWEISLPSNQISSNKCIWELVRKRGENHEL